MRFPLLALAGLTLAGAAPIPDPDLTTVRGDLKRLLGAQESYFSDHNSYSADLAALKFAPSDSVTIKITEFHPASYAAVGFVKGKETASCVYFINQVSSIPRTARGKVAEAEGGIMCDD